MPVIIIPDLTSCSFLCFEVLCSKLYHTIVKLIL